MIYLTILNLILLIVIIYILYKHINKESKDTSVFPIVKNEVLSDDTSNEFLSNQDLKNLSKSFTDIKSWHIHFFYSDKKGKDIFYYMDTMNEDIELLFKFKDNKIIAIRMKHPIRREIKKFLNEFTKSIYPIYEKTYTKYNEELKDMSNCISEEIIRLVPTEEIRNDKLNDLLNGSSDAPETIT